MRNVKDWRSLCAISWLILLKEKGQKLIEQIHYWLDNTVDQMNALEALLTATEGLAENGAKVWDNYYAGLSIMTNRLAIRSSMWTTMALQNLGYDIFVHLLIIWKNTWQRIFKQCFIPDKSWRRLLQTLEGRGGLEEVTDGDFDTHVIVKTTTVIERDDYGGAYV